MFTTLLIPLALAGGISEPVDPDLEIAVIDATWDPTICVQLDHVVTLLAGVLDDDQLALDLIAAYSVEQYEEGYGQNLTEPAEEHLIDIIEDCVR